MLCIVCITYYVCYVMYIITCNDSYSYNYNTKSLVSSCMQGDMFRYSLYTIV